MARAAPDSRADWAALPRGPLAAALARLPLEERARAAAVCRAWAAAVADSPAELWAELAPGGSRNALAFLRWAAAPPRAAAITSLDFALPAAAAPPGEWARPFARLRVLALSTAHPEPAWRAIAGLTELTDVHLDAYAAGAAASRFWAHATPLPPGLCRLACGFGRAGDADERHAPAALAGLQGLAALSLWGPHDAAVPVWAALGALPALRDLEIVGMELAFTATPPPLLGLERLAIESAGLDNGSLNALWAEAQATMRALTASPRLRTLLLPNALCGLGYPTDEWGAVFERASLARLSWSFTLEDEDAGALPCPLPGGAYLSGLRSLEVTAALLREPSGDEFVRGLRRAGRLEELVLVKHGQDEEWEGGRGGEGGESSDGGEGGEGGDGGESGDFDAAAAAEEEEAAAEAEAAKAVAAAAAAAAASAAAEAAWAAAGRPARRQTARKTCSGMIYRARKTCSGMIGGGKDAAGVVEEDSSEEDAEEESSSSEEEEEQHPHGAFFERLVVELARPEFLPRLGRVVAPFAYAPGGAAAARATLRVLRPALVVEDLDEAGEWFKLEV